MKKLKRKNGFSLVEMLLAVLILALLSTAATVATTTVLSTSGKTKGVARAEILGSEVLNVVVNEMRFCGNVKFDENGKLIDFSSASYGEQTTIFVDNGKLFIRSAGVTEPYSPIGSTMYDGLSIKTLSLTKNGTNGLDVSVTISDGTSDVYTGSSSVALLNN